MGSFLLFAFSWWSILLRVVAIIHFIRRRPNFFWLWVILFHWVGALVYILVEVIPDAPLLRGTFQVFPRRRRIQELERTVLDNPSAGNYEELGDLYMDEGKLQPARAAFNNAIAARAYTLDPFYQRGVCAILLGDAAAALPDLERTVAEDFDHDFYRAAGLLAHAYAQTGEKERAEALFRKVTAVSTASETYLNFASLLALHV